MRFFWRQASASIDITASCIIHIQHFAAVFPYVQIGLMTVTVAPNGIQRCDTISYKNEKKIRVPLAEEKVYSMNS